jgi:hypothetical protein
VQTIKSLARREWGERPRARTTWYEPLEDQADIDLAVGDIAITATAPGNVGAIQLEDVLTTFAGSRINYYFTVLADELTGTQVSVDRRSIETTARITFFHSAANHGAVDLYVVEPGTSVEDALPRQIGAANGLQTPPVNLAAGSYDLYITTSGEKTVLDGPISLEVALGDVFEAVLLDRVDPSLAEFRLFPPPWSPGPPCGIRHYARSRRRSRLRYRLPYRWPRLSVRTWRCTSRDPRR